MIRVLLADDHALLRQGTRALLEAAPDIVVVGEAPGGEEALRLAASLEPDVVLLDIRLHGLGGIDVARQLRQDLPRLKVVILTAYHYEQYVRALFAVGVHGYLLKSTSGDELIAAVRAVLAGEQVLSTEIRELSDGPAAGLAANPTLSERERQVLSLVAQGATNKQIATDLVISVRTVEAHIGNAMAKLQARSRAEAITRAIQRGTIVPDEPL